MGRPPLISLIVMAKRGLINETNLCCSVVDEVVLDPHELPTAWGLLVRKGSK